MVITFPQAAPQRIKLSLPRCEGAVPSWRVVFPRYEVPVLTPDNGEGADREGYFPMVACYLEAIGCRPQFCEDSLIFIDDGLSRCSVTINIAKILAPPGIVPVSQSLEYKINAAVGAIPSPVMHHNIAIVADPLDPLAPSITRGIMCEVSGILCTQFEVWARISPNNQFGPAMPVEIRFQMMVDRAGSAAFAYEGQKDLPHLP